MQQDPQREDSFRTNRNWSRLSTSIVPFMYDQAKDSIVGYSFSGLERNRMFLGSGSNFVNVSLVSGADFRQDARCFALFDYDLDGFLDMFLVSTNSPRLRVLQNRMASAEKAKRGNWVSFSLVGGSDEAEPSEQYSSRQPFNALITVKTGAVERRFRYSCFDGLKNQNSEWQHIGLGTTEVVDQVTIAWPSGRRSVLKNVKAGKRYTISEKDD